MCWKLTESELCEWVCQHIHPQIEHDISSINSSSNAVVPVPVPVISRVAIAMRNRRPTGFASIEFTSVQLAEAAMEALRGKLCRGRDVETDSYQPPPTKQEVFEARRSLQDELDHPSSAWLSNLPMAATEEDLGAELGGVLGPDIFPVRIEILRAKKGGVVHMPTGRVMVQFSSDADRDAAVERLHNSRVLGREISAIAYTPRHLREAPFPSSESRERLNYRGGAGAGVGGTHSSSSSSFNPFTSIILSNLPFNISQDDIFSHVSHLGQVTHVCIFKEAGTDRGKGVAAVEFSMESSVDDAMEHLAGTNMFGREIRVRRAEAF